LTSILCNFILWGSLTAHFKILQIQQIPWAVRWLAYVSPFRWAYEGNHIILALNSLKNQNLHSTALVINEMSDQEFYCTPEQMIPPTSDPLFNDSYSSGGYEGNQVRDFLFGFLISLICLRRLVQLRMEIKSSKCFIFQRIRIGSGSIFFPSFKIHFLLNEAFKVLRSRSFRNRTGIPIGSVSAFQIRVPPKTTDSKNHEGAK
jgi:hypothetical protein